MSIYRRYEKAKKWLKRKKLSPVEYEGWLKIIARKLKI